MTAKALFSKISFILIISLLGCGNMFDKNKTKFYWLATESAPSNYPMRIIEGTFYYHNAKGGLYVPTAASINSGWGTMVSSHVVGEDYKPLPDRLDIRFFSFAENKLYQGSFDLPYEKILALFKAGVAKDKDNPTFKRIMVGVAPGGAVAVWVMGGEYREVFFGQAEPYEAEIRNPLDGEITDRKAYARRHLERLPAEVIADIDKNGVPIGRWAEYRKKFLWTPTFVQAQIPKYAGISFFNGESYKIYFPLESSLKNELKPVPWIFSFSYLISGETEPDHYDVRFNETEIYEAFVRLGAGQEKIHIEFDPRLPKELTKVRIYNSQESIELKKFTIDK